MVKIVLMFAGQGAQYAGMGKELYESSFAAKKVFDVAEAIRPGTIKQCFFADEETLATTINTQPCLFAVDLACAQALRERGVVADGVAGFSLGELAAAAYSGMLDMKDAFRAVCRRAELMQKCAEETPGAMCAVGKLSTEQVKKIAAEFEHVYPVNYNSPGQTVVSGDVLMLGEFEKRVKEQGGRTMRLKVKGGFHSAFMRRAAEEFLLFLKTLNFQKPKMPLYANATAQPYEHDFAELLAKQIESPVLWQSTIETMIAAGFDAFVEVGAGKTLCGLVKKIDEGQLVTNVENPRTLEETIDIIMRGIK